MLELAKTIYRETGKKAQAVLGYRDSTTFLAEEFKPYAEVYLATEDGSVGTKGNVLDAIREQGLATGSVEKSPAEKGSGGVAPESGSYRKPVVFYACGPTPMLRGIKAYAAEQGIPAQISLEERMACGIGACLACVCQSNEVDSHTHVKNKRICKDGPVFYAEEVEL